MKKRKIVMASCLIIVIVCMITAVWFVNDKRSEIPQIKIGVPLLNSAKEKYDLLKENLKANFQMDVTFVDLYREITSDDSEQELMSEIDHILKNDDVDMIIGIPPHQLEYAIRNDRFLDLSDLIQNKDKMHKGVIDKSMKMGDGRMYYISPVVNHISFLMQNKNLLNRLNQKPVENYISWEDFLNKLDEVQVQINHMQEKIQPLALSVKNAGEDLLFSAYDFETHAFGLDSKSCDESGLSKNWEEFYKLFSKIIYKYGSDLEDMENGRYPKNFIFLNGSYVFLFADSYDIETLLNKSFNEEYNKTAPIKLELDFPVETAFISLDGSKLQNFRDSSIAINRKSNNIKLCTDIMNYFMSKEYAFEILKNRGKFCFFSTSLFSYPVYYDKDTIKELNSLYHSKFDANKIYDAECGSVIYNTNQSNQSELFDNILNKGFTRVYNGNKRKGSEIFLQENIQESLEYVNDQLKRIQ